MTEFQNSLVLKDEPFKGGLFPQIPNCRKEGSAFILTDGVGDDLLVTGRTTTKELRQGKYTRCVEISTKAHRKEIWFTTPSKEPAYSFRIYIRAVVQVNDPLTFYANRNLDVDAYFENLFSMDVRKITRKYSILDYDGMDEELTDRLAAYNNFDDSTGFSYQVSIVVAEPDENASEYVKKYSMQQLDMKLKQDARELTSSLSGSLPEALKTAVVEGRMTEEEAFQKIAEYENSSFKTELERLNALRDNDILTDEESRKYARARILGASPAEPNRLTEEASEGKKEEENMIDALYDEEE